MISMIDSSEKSDTPKPGVHTKKVASLPQRELSLEQIQSLQQIPGVEISTNEARPGEPASVDVVQHSIILPESKDGSGTKPSESGGNQAPQGSPDQR